MKMATIRNGSMCFLAVAATLGLSACSDDPEPSTAKPVVDSGTTPTDTGTTPDDTGTPPGDSGEDTTAPGCPASPPVEEVTADISAATEWTCAKTYLLKKFVEVKPGATLKIGAGTVIKGIRGTGSGEASITGIAVLPGAKIEAMGTKDAPIVMTSNEATPARGDWAGLMILGKAKTNHATTTFPEGLTAKPQFEYGGSGAGRDDADSSGELHYVRVEWAGFALSPGNEINSFSWYGVGSGTKVDHLEALQGFDDSFEFFGGAVQAKYLVAASGNDDCFDMDNGFRGKLQFGICNRDDIAGGGNGFEVDNDATGSSNMPYTEPTLYNFTMIGKDTATTEGGHGFHLRRNTKGKWFNILAVNWPLSGLYIQSAGTDGTGAQANATDGSLAVMNSIVGGISKNGNDAFADAYIANTAHNIRTMNLDAVKITNTSSTAPNFALQAGSPALTGAATPPSDGFFDENGKNFVGACGTDCSEFAGWTSFK